jgi:cytochrome-b5 reductase
VLSHLGTFRLGSSGEDLTGLKGKTINVSHQELAKHNKREDCWCAVRGKVYNITRYLDFHPGGADQLMRGAGIDATSLFDEFHAWVNIDQLLAKCYVGPLRNTAILNLKDSLFSSSSDIRTKLSPPSTSPLKRFSSILSVSSETLTKGSQDVMPAPSPLIEIIPRFDWIQKTPELSIYFYTKGFCNPGISVEFRSDKEFAIKITIGNTSNSYKFSFLKALKWPCSIKMNHETGE